VLDLIVGQISCENRAGGLGDFLFDKVLNIAWLSKR
jgi:hypothetical protein